MVESASLSDEQLIELARMGESGAFERLIRRYDQDLLRFLVRFTGDRTLAEDVFQDTFIQVITKAEHFDTSRRFKPWLYTVAANKARDLLRKKNRRSAVSLSQSTGSSDSDARLVDFLSDDGLFPETQMSLDETRQQVREVVDQLPPHQREVLLLAYFQKLAYQDIGAMLDIPLGTVKSRMHSAVANFAELWKSANPDELTNVS